jgi:purine-nucleoside/S-methyl-5'-thioadenosine phosphorylase / adenosine deaminase
MTAPLRVHMTRKGAVIGRRGRAGPDYHPAAMELAQPFAWQGDHIAIELPGGRALFTTRRGGVSATPYDSLNLGRGTDDDPAAVAANYERAAAAAALAPTAIAQGYQVHGTTVIRVTAPPDGNRPESGQATALHGVAALVLTADCLPVALIAPGAVAMVHAGWRGLAAGVLEEGIAAIRELSGDSDGPIAAAIGPGAGGCCYEVGDEVRQAFAGHPAAHHADGTIDLKAIAAGKLRAAGATEVHDAALCTMCAEPGVFYSHRRERGLTGRQAGIAWRA